MQAAPKNRNQRATRRLRGEVIEHFARVEQAVGSVLIYAAALPEYQELELTLPPLMTKKLEHLRMLMNEDGPLRSRTVEVAPLLDKFGEFDKLRNFMAHGIVQMELNQSAGPTYVFRMIRPSSDDPSNSTLKITGPEAQSRTAKLASVAKELTAKRQAITASMEKRSKTCVDKDVR
jgi:hypothetical protein